MNNLDQIISSFASAFFPFVFFVIKQSWIKSNDKRDETITNLNTVKEFIAIQIPRIIFNRNKAKEFNSVDVSNPIQIFVKRWIISFIQQ